MCADVFTERKLGGGIKLRFKIVYLGVYTDKIGYAVAAHKVDPECDLIAAEYFLPRYFALAESGVNNVEGHVGVGLPEAVSSGVKKRVELVVVEEQSLLLFPNINFGIIVRAY